jgi:mannose-6-phosphate isomerase-like protein (cupin superfamily)
MQEETMPETPALAPITDADPSEADMEARVARFRALRTTDAYVDAGIPGFERDTYPVLGHVPGAPLAAESFFMNLVRCAPGKAAPLHNHLTQEVFIALTGTWQVFWGPTGARAITLEPFDVISIPPGVSRGFRNVGAAEAWLIGIAGGPDPGRINWPEPVRALARAAGVALPVE